jgi:hypothetical protein
VRDISKGLEMSIIPAGRNLGFAGGNDLGFSKASGEFIVLLNNDTVVDGNWLEALVKRIDSDENTGIVQSLVLTKGIPAKYYEKNGTINLLGHNIMQIFEIGLDGSGEILVATGCSMIIRKSLAEEIGGLFPEEYFAYSEDTYLSLKVKFRGLKIVHDSASVVHHEGGGTSGGAKSPLYFYQERNRLLNFLVFFKAGFIVKYLPYLMLNFLMKSAVSLLSRKYSFIQLCRAYGWLLVNAGWIKKQRSFAKSIKKVDDDQVLGYITSKITGGRNLFERIIDIASLAYCKMAFIRILENRK